MFSKFSRVISPILNCETLFSSTSKFWKTSTAPQVLSHAFSISQPKSKLEVQATTKKTPKLSTTTGDASTATPTKKSTKGVKIPGTTIKSSLLKPLSSKDQKLLEKYPDPLFPSKIPLTARGLYVEDYIKKEEGNLNEFRKDAKNEWESESDEVKNNYAQQVAQQKKMYEERLKNYQSNALYYQHEWLNMLHTLQFPNVSGYVVFFKEFLEKIKEGLKEDERIVVSECMKECAKQWNKMKDEEKKQYQMIANDEKTEFKKKLKELEDERRTGFFGL